jgi:pseudaminic acid cytidylyltransferase
LSNVCIIPARGGSKRIPRKNINFFLGKPIISYSIEMALSTGLFDEVMVSTEDKEIASIAIEYGARVPFFRSEDTSNDYSTTMDVLKEVISQYRSLGQEYDVVCCLYPTAVLSKMEDIQIGYQLLNEADMVLPVTEFSFPPLRSFKVSNQGFAEYCYPEHVNTRSQDLEAWYHDAGQWYWFQTETLFMASSKIRRRVLKLSNMQVQDIDNKDDWDLAELKFKILQNHV